MCTDELVFIIAVVFLIQKPCEFLLNKKNQFRLGNDKKISYNTHLFYDNVSSEYVFGVTLKLP